MNSRELVFGDLDAFLFNYLQIHRILSVATFNNVQPNRAECPVIDFINTTVGNALVLVDTSNQ